ncbi:hypothetical protein ACEQPO_02490 [Bacillus sp. SL00103]
MEYRGASYREDILNGFEAGCGRAGDHACKENRFLSAAGQRHLINMHKPINYKSRFRFGKKIIDHEEEGSPFQTPALFNIEEHAEILTVQLTKDQTDILLRHASQAYRTGKRFTLIRTCASDWKATTDHVRRARTRGFI